MSVLLAHSGKQHSYHVAKALNDLGSLEKFVTSSYIGNRSLQGWLTDSNEHFWSRRFIKGLGGDKVEANWRFELKELIYARLYGSGERTQQAVYDRDVAFDTYLSKRMGKYAAEMYWGFQGSSLLSLESAKKHGKLTICEMATGHLPTAERILGEECELLPDWADSFDHLKFPGSYYQRLLVEPGVADQVVAASEFSRRTLIDSGLSKEKVKLLPLGFDSEQIHYNESRFERIDNRPLKLLYTGRVTQRKGIYYLLEALSQFSKDEVELDIIGFIHGSGKGFKKYASRVNLLPAVSQQQLFDRYSNYDALVLPTLFEGFGLVIIEAMAAGVPVITTEHSVGPELIDHGQNGFIVPVRDVESIVLAIQQLVELDEPSLMEMRRKARTSAMQYSWVAYQSRLGSLLKELGGKP